MACTTAYSRLNAGDPETKKPLCRAAFCTEFLSLHAEVWVASAERNGRRDWTRTNDPHHVKVVL